MSDMLLVQGILVSPNCHLDVMGDATIVADAGTISSYSGVDHTIPAPTLISATGVQDWTPYAGRRVRVVSGPRAGSVAWLAIVGPGGVSPAIAAICPFGAIDTTSTYGNSKTVNAAIGDQLVVEDLPQVPSIRLFIDGVPPNFVGTQWNSRSWSIQHVDCRQLDTRGTTKSGNYSLVFGCRMGSHLDDPTHVLGPGYARHRGCHVAYQDQVDSSTCTLQGSYASSWMSGTDVQVRGGMLCYLQSCLFTTRLYCNEHCTTSLSSVQFFDVPYGHDALGLFWEGTLYNVSGSRNAWRGLTFGNGVRIKYLGTINLTGAWGAGRIYQPVVEFATCQQMLQPDDYAQKGTATLVGGVATVELLWWDPSVQKLTLTRNTPSGTLGDLSAPQTSRTTSGFVINSTSELDTSTVDWQISPLGRNVFVVRSS